MKTNENKMSAVKNLTCPIELNLNEVVILEMLLEKRLLDLPQTSQSYSKVSNLLQRFYTEMSGSEFAIKSMENVV
jgi:hypothetical protein